MAVVPRAPAMPGESLDEFEQRIADSRTPFREALITVLAEQAETGDGTRLRALARALVAQAEAGDRESLREVLERLDGRPFSVAEPERPPRKVVFGWKDAFDKPVRFGNELPRRVTGN